MVCVNRYDQTYIDACRASIERQVDTYHALAATGARLSGAAATRFETALEAFEPEFFNNLVLALDHFFANRSRSLEKKDGNPVNEVRVLARSLTAHAGRLVGDTQIRLDPARSVLGYRLGDEIALCEARFLRLAKAYFAEIEARYR
ncbi:hypothetical protein [Embleya sp. MST-111070]|uniref:hypothetical protein n=1 Tax=Embleya sp. MST-111070 TaxID=3398231 RepID=UPI003F73F4BA